MEAYVRQKRAAPGMIQASDLQIMRPGSAVSSGSAGARPPNHLQQNRDSHAYDGPMQFMMSPNPDQLLPVSPSNEGNIN